MQSGSGEDRAGSDKGPEIVLWCRNSTSKIFTSMVKMGGLLVKWLARIQCVLFWSEVLTSREYDGRLLRRIAPAAVRLGRVTWIGKMGLCWGQFGWKDVSVEVLKELSAVEVREMLEAIAWRKVWEEWGKEMERKPKLEMLKRIVKLGEWSECVRVWRRSDRRMMMKLRGGTAGFEIETGRWRGVVREERVCKLCDSSEVEDVGHRLMRCEAWGAQHIWRIGWNGTLSVPKILLHP